MAGYYGKGYEKPDNDLLDSTQDVATPSTDYNSYQDSTPNPYAADNDTSTGQDALVESSAESQKPAEQPAPQTEAQRTEVAAQQNANLHAAIPNDEYLNNSGITANQWQSMTAVLNSPNAQQFITEMNSTPEGKAILNAYNSYYATPAAAPAAQPQQAPAQNPILPSAGGNYRADDIYDPNKTYGRQADGSYVYSSSAAQLQRDLNRVMNAGLTVDGYFGEKTQEALNNYLAQYGSKTGNAATGPNENVPMSQAGSMSAALVQSAAEAPKTTTPTGKSEVGSKYSKSSGHDDAWYADQYEKLTGKAPRTDILSPDRIKSFVDEELSKQKNQPTDIDESAKQAWEDRQTREQEKKDEIEANRDEAFTPKFINDLKNGKSVEQIIGEGDLSYNRWIQDNWDDLSYTYNLGSEFPSNDERAEQLALYSELEDTYRDSVVDKNGMTRPSQAGDSMSRALENYAEPARRNPINYDAMANELFQMDRNDWYQRPEARQEGGQVYGSPRNGGVQKPYDNAPVVGNEDANLQDLIEEANRRAEQGYLMETPSAPTGNGAYWDANRGETRSPEGRASWTNAWTQTPEYQELLRQRQLEDIERAGRRDTDYYSKVLDALQTQPETATGEVYGSPRNGSIPERYMTPRERTYSPETIAPDDVQSTSTESSEDQEMLNAYEAAMQSAGRARDIFQGLPTETEQIQQTREQWTQNMQNALEQQLGPYMQQFQQEFAQLKQKFPNYSDTALMDMVLVNEEMRNGQSSYYKWLANSLG